MNRSTVQDFWTWSSLSRYALALVVVVLISFLFPQREEQNFAYELGKVWENADLYAPAPLALIEEALPSPDPAALQLPTYSIDRDRIEKDQLAFAQDFQSQLTIVRQDRAAYFDLLRFPDKYLNYGRQLIRSFYEIGVLPNNAVFDPDQQSEILVDDGVATKRRSVKALLNKEAVDIAIGDSLFNSGLSEAEFLFPLLKKHLQANLVLQTDGGEVGETEIAKPRMIPIGALLVAQGDTIDETVLERIAAYEQWQLAQGNGRSKASLIFIGYFLLTSMLIGLLLFYLQFHAPQAFNNWRQLSFMLLWLIVYSYLVYSLENLSALSIYVVPFCIVPLIIKVFFNDRLALFAHLVLVLIASILTSEGYEFTFLTLMAGVVVVLSNIELRNWSRFFYTIWYIFLAYAIGFLGLSLIQTGNWAAVEWNTYQWLFLNGLLTLLAYPLIPLLERIFGFVSAITLMELSDMNQPLLKELSIVAPGTLQHSLQVANLAEAAANTIDADPLLVKVAALYHDIGKIPQAPYFIENQSGDNPHDQIDPLASAQLIIEHVTEGEKMARKAKLPEVLIDFIRSHHGTTRVEYFYQRYRQQYPERPLDPSAFRYPGPKPRSKEETILLLADSLEAASKSLQKPTEKELDELVDRIVAHKISQGQLLESQLNFRELDRCVIAFKQLLKSIHHLRVEYPSPN